MPLRAPKIKKRKLILLAVALLLISLTAVFFITGYFAGVHYTGSVRTTIHAPANKVWALLNDTKRFNANRHEVRSVQLLPNDEQGMKCWREHTMLAGDMYFTMIDSQPGQLLVIKMTKSDFGMHGIWEFRLVPVGDYTQVTITERSYTEGLVMRSILNTVGRYANMHLLQKAIEKGVNNDTKI